MKKSLNFSRSCRQNACLRFSNPPDIRYVHKQVLAGGNSARREDEKILAKWPNNLVITHHVNLRQGFLTAHCWLCASKDEGKLAWAGAHWGIQT